MKKKYSVTAVLSIDWINMSLTLSIMSPTIFGISYSTE